MSQLTVVLCFGIVQSCRRDWPLWLNQCDIVDRLWLLGYGCCMCPIVATCTWHHMHVHRVCSADCTCAILCAAHHCNLFYESSCSSFFLLTEKKPCYQNEDVCVLLEDFTGLSINLSKASPSTKHFVVIYLRRCTVISMCYCWQKHMQQSSSAKSRLAAWTMQHHFAQPKRPLAVTHPTIFWVPPDVYNSQLWHTEFFAPHSFLKRRPSVHWFMSSILSS